MGLKKDTTAEAPALEAKIPEHTDDTTSTKPQTVSEIVPSSNNSEEISTTQTITQIQELVGDHLHDSGNLIGAAFGAIELLEKLIENPSPEISKQITAAKEAIDRLIGIHYNFRRTTSSFPPKKIIPSSGEIMPSQYDLNKLIRAELESQEKLDNHNTQFEANIPHEVIVLGDEHDIHKILDNLIINAKQAILKTNRAGIIRISTSVDNDFAYIRISDNGCGIAPEDRNSIFNKGFTTKEKSESHGIGLYYALRRAKGMGGEIYFEFDDGSTLDTDGLVVVLKLRLLKTEE